MARFLTQEWLEEMQRAADGATLPDGASIVVGQEVSATPDGDVAYRFTVAEGRITFAWSTTEGADITLIDDYETAVALATGVLAAQQAVAEGRLKLRGDVGALVRSAPAMAVLGDLFRAVRESTEF